MVIHRKVNDAAAELKQRLAWIAVAFVLLDGVLPVCLVRLFFSSKVITGSPLMKAHKSSDRLFSWLKCSCRVMLKRFFAWRSTAFAFSAEGLP